MRLTSILKRLKVNHKKEESVLKADSSFMFSIKEYLECLLKDIKIGCRICCLKYSEMLLYLISIKPYISFGKVKKGRIR